MQDFFLESPKKSNTIMNKTSLTQQISDAISQPSHIIVSACLVGINCRYDGKSQFHPEFASLRDQHFLIPVCPEQLGGLPTPRPPAEIQHGTGQDVFNNKVRILTNTEQSDVTEAFVRGAHETLKIAQFFKATVAILQQRSPSCGFGKIYNEHKITSGNGVTATILQNAGLTIFSIE